MESRRTDNRQLQYEHSRNLHGYSDPEQWLYLNRQCYGHRQHFISDCHGQQLQCHHLHAVNYDGISQRHCFRHQYDLRLLVESWRSDYLQLQYQHSRYVYGVSDPE